MIVFHDVSLISVERHKRKSYSLTKPILSSVNLVIPSGRHIALLGPSAMDKSSLLNLLGGIVMPTAGRIVKTAKVSFPVGFLGSFHKELPVRRNLEHFARIYDIDPRVMVEYIERVAGLGAALDGPYGHLSSGMKAHLGRILALIIPFDIYLLSSGSINFARGKNDIAWALFEERFRTAGMIISVRNPRVARDYCDMGLVIGGGKLKLYDNVDQAIAVAAKTGRLLAAAD